MKKNTIMDLNDHLFTALERINDEELSGEELETEVKRCGAISNIAREIIATEKLAFNVFRFREDTGSEEAVPRMLETSE